MNVVIDLSQLNTKQVLPKNKAFSMKINKEKANMLDEIAKKNNVSRNAILNELVDIYLLNYQQQHQ